MNKRIVRLCLFLLAAFGIIDTIIMVNRSGGVDTGILLPSLIGIVLIFCLLFSNSKTYNRNKKQYDKLGKIIFGLFTLWLVSFIVVAAIILTSAISDRDTKVDCVIVLGAGLKGDKPTSVLKERLDNTINYLEKFPETTVVVSGGQGFGESITEAEGMKRYLLLQGIPEKVILKEESATSTYENMVYSKKLYEQTVGQKLDTVMIITNNFHMFRSKLLAERAGLKAYGISSGTPWYIYPNVFLREYLAIFKSLLFDK